MAGAKPRTGRKRKAAAFVYVLGCLAGARHLTYVGWTNDVARRLAKHNSGKGAWALLHSEGFADKRAAMSREWHLKRDRGFRRQLAMALRAEAAE